MNNEEMSKSIRYNCCKSDRYNINFHICYLYLKKKNNNNNNNNKIPNNSVNLHGTRANKIFKNTRDITRNISTRSNGININYKCYDCIKGYPNLDVSDGVRRSLFPAAS